VIAHVCNDRGGWGRGFVQALSARWPEPEKAYRDWYRNRNDNNFGLGATQLVQVTPDLWVANMIGQHGITTRRTIRPPVRYDAVRQALHALAEHALGLDASVHMPRIGCGLAGGEWELIEPIITAELVGHGVSATVYDILSVVDEFPT
jgi:O-acetyl-ADP-ribose deacetylase (regulator of RNase III)